MDESNLRQGDLLKPVTRSASMPKTVKSMPKSVQERVPPTRKDPRKLFVGGLPTDVTEEEFLLFFQQFGEVLDSVVMIDRETRRSRGFGFVTFAESQVAQSILAIGGGVDGIGRLEMRGKVCEVKPAEPRGVVFNRNLRSQSNQKPQFMSSQPQAHYFPSTNPGAHDTNYVDSGIQFPFWPAEVVPPVTGYAPIYYQNGPYHMPPTPTGYFVGPNTFMMPQDYPDPASTMQINAPTFSGGHRMQMPTPSILNSESLLGCTMKR